MVERARHVTPLQTHATVDPRCVSHQLTAEARDRPAITSLSLLEVLIVQILRR